MVKIILLVLSNTISELILLSKNNNNKENIPKQKDLL